jgi:hypothetical protein
MQNTAPLRDKRTDPRFPASAVPSITGVSLSNGDVVNLVNISRTGVLIEGCTRFIPGMRATIMFQGTFRPPKVKGTIVRCQVSSIDGGSLRYQSAIEFEKRLEHSPVDQPAEAPTVPAEAIAVAVEQPESSNAIPRQAQNRWY